MADAAKREVYVCFEGPLGAHLKADVKEKIWKGEYVEIFTLLPLEKFNLDRLKPEERKKEDEEKKRRYRLIPRTFSNWLQAFAILASVVGEKAPEHCSALFVYLDAISEAHRTYGGVAWLRYDEQFRQRMAVRPSLRWDHKDISLWMKLMTAARAPNQFFQAGVGGSAAPGQPTDKKWGFCWQFNEGTCKFGATCRFKHTCSGCGGSHALSKCFRDGVKVVEESLRTRGKTPVLVERMRPFLSRYPDREAAQLLDSGFESGFKIPCSLEVAPPLAKNLQSALMHPSVVAEK